MKFNWQAIIIQLKDPATWRGIFALLTAVGVAVNPDQQDKIVAAGLAIIGLIGVFGNPPQPQPPLPPLVEKNPQPPV